MADQTRPAIVPLDYEPLPARPRRRWYRWMALAAVAIGFAAIALMGIGRLSVRDRSTVPFCQNNLRRIGLELQLYARHHQGYYPAGFGDLLTYDVNAEVFVCPSSTDIKATGITAAALAADFAKPGRCSYIYVGTGLNDATVTANRVLAYESVQHHGEGIAALFGDGHVALLTPGALQWYLSVPRPASGPVKP